MRICYAVLFASLFVGCSTVTIPNSIANRVPKGIAIQDVQRIIFLAIEGAKNTTGDVAANRSQQFLQALADTLQSDSEWNVVALQLKSIRATTQRQTQDVEVKIHYSKTRWWIKIQDGRNVRYDGHHIHEQALLWVKQLEKRIRRAFGIYATIQALEREEEEEI